MNFRKIPFILFFLLTGLTPVIFTFFLYNRTRVVSDHFSYLVNGGMMVGLLFVIFASTLYALKDLKADTDDSFLILLGLVCLFIGPVITQWYGYVPKLNTKIFIVIASYLMIYLYKDEFNVNSIAKMIRWLILFYIYGSIAAVFIVPTVAVDLNYYQGLFPWFKIRIAGITNHANSLSPLIFIYAVLDYYFPKKNKLRYVHLTLAFVLLIFTQSKTTILLLLGFYAVILLMKWGNKFKQILKKISFKWGILLPFVLMILASLPFLNKLLQYVADKKLYEFTGRNEVWAATVAEWSHNPVFGFGLTLWGQKMQDKYLPIIEWAPGHAHSQFFQTLGESGIIGVLGLVFYVALLLFFSIKYAKYTKGFSLVFPLFLLFRGITEPVFVNTTDNIAYFIHFLMITMLMTISVQYKKEIQTAPAVGDSGRWIYSGRLKPELVKNSLFVSIFFIYAFFIIIYTLVNPRSFPGGTILIDLTQYNSYLNFAVCLLSLLMAAWALILNSSMKMEKTNILLSVTALLFLFSAVLSSFFGSKPSRIDFPMVEFLLFFMISFIKDVDWNFFARFIKRALLLFVYGTVLFSFLFPYWSFQRNYDQGLFSSFDIRLHGLTNNANNTASIILLYLLFEMQFPSKSKLKYIHIFVGLILLLLTQSKTIWVLLFFFFCAKVLFHYWDKMKKYFKLKIIIPLGIVAVALGLYVVSVPAAMQMVTGNENIVNVTGRTTIWKLTVEDWKKNKLFGHGMGLWNDEMFQEYKDQVKNGWTFSHAHNQYFQSLGESGIIGITCLLLYLSVLLYLGIRYFKVTKGMSLIFALYPIIRGWTEPVFRHYALDVNFFIHFIIFAYFIVLVKSHPLGKKEA